LIDGNRHCGAHAGEAVRTEALWVHLKAERLDVRQALFPQRKPPLCGGFMELAGLEPATSWVRSRRSPN
jgi:hypothetical protein